MSALNKKQKFILSDMARRAFNRAGAIARGRMADGSAAHTMQGDLDQLALDGGRVAEENWRHAQVALACGKHGLRLCGQDDYALVKAHFERLLGMEAKSIRTEVHAAGQARRQVEIKILQACEQWGVKLSYAATLAKGKRLDECTVGELWQVLYTLNNRGKALRDKAIEQAAAKAENTLFSETVAA